MPSEEGVARYKIEGDSSLFETGLAMNGERFAAMEVTTTLSGGQEVVYITESGQRFPFRYEDGD